MRKYLGIDLGGTKIATGVVTEKGEILHKKGIQTNPERPAEKIVQDIAEISLQTLKEAGCTINEIESIGIGSPGIVNAKSGVVEYANNLNFDNVPLASMVESALGKKVILENDANAAAYGEFIAGCGKEGCDTLAAVTLGTGIGGGLIIDRKIYHGFNYGSAEFGHTVICVDGKECSCGKKGCFEAYCSASALILQTKEAMEKNPSTILWELCGKDINHINGKSAFDGMRAGDSVSIDLIKNYLKYLSIGVSNIINWFQPQVLCIGGGLSKEQDTIIKPLSEMVIGQTYIQDPKMRTKITVAQLGNDAGIIGAAFLSKQYE